MLLFHLKRLFGHVGKWLDKRTKDNFKVYDATDWKTIHKLSNISRSNGNQATKFGQLIKYNMRNIFLQKSYIRCGGETSSKPFPKNPN